MFDRRHRKTPKTVNSSAGCGPALNGEEAVAGWGKTKEIRGIGERGLRQSENQRLYIYISISPDLHSPPRTSPEVGESRTARTLLAYHTSPRRSAKKRTALPTVGAGPAPLYRTECPERTNKLARAWERVAPGARADWVSSPTWGMNVRPSSVAMAQGHEKMRVLRETTVCLIDVHISGIW